MMALAAFRTAVTCIVTLIYVLWQRRSGCSSPQLFDGRPACTALGHGGVRLALAACRHPLRGGWAVSTCRRTARSSSARITRATSIHRSFSRRFTRSCTSSTKPSSDSRSSGRSSTSAGSCLSNGQPRQSPGVHLPGGSGAARRFVLPDLPGRHAQPHRGVTGLQEGRDHHGPRGPGAGRAGGYPWRTARNAEGQRHHQTGDAPHPGSANPSPPPGLTIADRDALRSRVRSAVQALLAGHLEREVTDSV